MLTASEYKDKIAHLEAENRSLAINNKNLADSNKKLSLKVEELAAQLKWFQKQIFGKTSERRVVETPKEQLFLGAQFQKDKTEKEETQTIAEHQRKKRKRRSVDGDNEKLFFDDNVPVEEIKLENPEIKGLSEEDYEVISQKSSYRLAQRPAVYVILKYVRDVIKIKKDKEEEIICPAAPDSVFEKSHADVSFLTGLLIDKFMYHMPLYRQHQRLERAGVKVSRGWLSQLVHRCGNLVEPVYDALVESIRKSRVKIIDETPIKAGRKEKGKMRKAYFWPVMGYGGKEIVFFYFDSREHHHVFEALGKKPGANSVIVSDGYAAYKAYAKETKTSNAQCWSHVRREFIKAEDVEPERAKEAIDLIRPIYKVEKEIREKNLQGEEKIAYRLIHSKPLIEKFFSWVKKQRQDKALLPTNKFTKALEYVHKREDALKIFLTDSDVPIDTNEVERALRVIPMGRKNFLFCWTEVGARYVAIFQSFIVSCKMQGIDPFVYLVDILQRVSSHPMNEIDKLIPRKWKKHYASNPLRSDLDSIIYQ